MFNKAANEVLGIKSIYEGIDSKLDNITKDIELLKKDYSVRCGIFEFQIKLISTILSISILVTTLHLFSLI